MNRKSILYILSSLVLAVSFANCSDWTDAKSKDYFNPPKASYYESLRAFKETDHQLSFGWFGNWTGTGASLVNSMRGIPDSLDIVSLWGNWASPTEAQLTDMRFCQQVKGTKVVICTIFEGIGAGLTPQGEDAPTFWGYTNGDASTYPDAVKRYAHAFCDSINKYGYDGLDIDYERGYGPTGNMVDNDDNMLLFIQTMRELLGEHKTTGKLLLLDGAPQKLVPAAGPLIDYFVVQAYNCTGDATGSNSLDSRLNNTINNFKDTMTPEEVTTRYIVTETFESVAQALAGGVKYTDRYGNVMQSLEGMARWTPTNGFSKGGCGTYHMEAEYGTTPDYKWMRQAIQIMNPGLNTLK
jgi:hypothetical protein